MTAFSPALSSATTQTRTIRSTAARLDADVAATLAAMNADGFDVASFDVFPASEPTARGDLFVVVIVAASRA